MSAEQARREWISGWPMMTSCVAGMAAPILAHYAFGQFMAPMEHDLGWTRTQATMGLSLSLMVAFFTAPLVGRMADVMNVRYLAIVGLILTGGAFASFSLATSSVVLWVSLWFLHTACASLIGPVIWLAVIPTKFVAHRSFATAVALAGNSLTVAIGPPLAQWLINSYGWRDAYKYLAVVWFGAALVLTLLFFFDRRPHRAARAETAAQPRQGVGPLLDLLKSSTFLKLMAGIFGIMLIESAYLVHLAPAFEDKGFSPLDAAKFVSLAGVAAIVGKLVAGWLFDRASFDVVSAGFMAVLACACALFAPLGNQAVWATVICLMLGLTIGAMYTIMACTVRLLFGSERFGFVFGVLASSMALASALGPLLGGMVHDRFGSYNLVYWVGIGVAAMAALILRNLRRQHSAQTLAMAGG
jgi:predicted MFS family arabinose efflux permease